MASSQVELTSSSSSSSPFGCVLRDHNRRDTFREANGNGRGRDRSTKVVVFQNNLKTLVMDHLNDIDHVSISNHIGENVQDNASSIMSPRRSSILDRWATKQVQETLSSIHQQHNQNIWTIPSSPLNPNPNPNPDHDNEQTPPDTSSTETSKLGASCLVQIWEKRLNLNSNCMDVTPNTNTNPNSNDTVTACSSSQVPDERFDAGPECFADWHSNGTSSSSSSSCTQNQNWDAAGENSEVSERQRVRVADIIRRLVDSDNNNNNNNNIIESAVSMMSMRSEQAACFSQVVVVGSPRIRGRQAFADLLMQMERDRQTELDGLLQRRPVSKFAQRGRIQSLLRLRIMKRGVAVEEQQLQLEGSNNRSLQASSTIMHLRERFSRVGDNGGASQTHDTVTPLGVGEFNNKIQSSDICDSCSDNGKTKTKTMTVLHSIDKIMENSLPGDNVKKEEAAATSDVVREREADNVDLELVSRNNEWEKEDEDEECVAGNNNNIYDWFSDISRPRSYWEDRRKTWYQEMLHSNSDKHDIRQLIQRKTVSNFLSSSEFRERMDQLMVSRLEQQQDHGEEEEEDDNQLDGGVDQELWSSFSQTHDQTTTESESESESEIEISGTSGEEEEEAAASEYLDPSASLASPSILSSWSYHDNEDSNSHSNNRVASASSHSDNRQCSSRSHPSMEMELIYDLREHMEQLYREMSELRKSMKGCMEMQQQLMLQQQSISHNYNNKVVDDHPVAGKVMGKKWNINVEEKEERKCCICYEMEVDSLLYRCGHMCSCMKCGKEMQWRAAKCPICGSSIDDVVTVRANANPHL